MQHRMCHNCQTLFGEGSSEFTSGECSACMECSECNFITGDFDEMYSHHVEKHGHNNLQPLTSGYNQFGLFDAEECTCSPH